METYNEYVMPDGTTLLVEVDSEAFTGMTNVSRDALGNVINVVNQKFEDAIGVVTNTASAWHNRLESLDADEVEISFALKAVGELGVFAVGKVGADANFTVSIKWTGQKTSRGA